ncbi:hypothetical protein C0J52_05315 [Blattella germanica]|nr:hypothetical protein C0J52_05315 [Blattella germanica]
MKSLTTVLAVTCALFLLENVARAKKNKEEFDMDLAALINDQNKVRSFVDCLLQDMCTGYGERLRDMLMEALSRDCNTCTESQQGLISKAANYLMKENPDAWQKIVQKYDPQGKLKEIAPRTLM